MKNLVLLRKKWAVGLLHLEKCSLMTLDSLLFENLYWNCCMSKTIKIISYPTDFPCCHAGWVNLS